MEHKPGLLSMLALAAGLSLTLAVQGQVATTTALAASPVSSSEGTPVMLTATVKDATEKPVVTGSVSFANGKAQLGTSPLEAGGTAVLIVALFPAGPNAVTANYLGTPAYGASGSASVTVSVSPSSASSGCAGCFLSIGIGANLNPKSYSDYTNAANLLQTTHLGNASPQFLLGISYGLVYHGFFYNHLGCKEVYSGPQKLPAAQMTDAQNVYCYPWRAFVNVKFSPSSSQTFSGFTMGASYRVARSLDVMVGASFTPFNEVTHGFVAAAVQTVKTQQAAGNSQYQQFYLPALQGNWRDAFDGFPTTLINADGTQGSPIYAGSPLSVHYHIGGFVGVAVPVSFSSILGISSPQ